MPHPSQTHTATRSAMVGLLAGMTVGSLSFAGVYAALSEPHPDPYTGLSVMA